MLVVSITVSAQSFISEDNLWVTEETNMSTWVAAYKFMGDYEFNEKSYSRLYISINPFDFDQIEFVETSNYFREDSEGKVYTTWDDIIGTEIKIYDFNLKIGDQFKSGTLEYEIIGLDSVSLQDNTEARSWTYRTIENNIGIIVEGIGDRRAVFNPAVSFASNVDLNLLCFYRKGELVYSQSQLEGCTNNLSFTEKESLPEQVLFYISDQTIYLEGLEGNTLPFKIRNLMGQDIQSGIIRSGMAHLKKELPPGLLVCQIFNTSNQLLHSKLFYHNSSF